MRIGVSEEFADARLVRELQTFVAGYPGMQVKVQVGIPGSLLALMRQGELDLVVGSLCESDEPGLALWQEPLVWAWTAQPLYRPQPSVPGAGRTLCRVWLASVA